MTSKICAGEFDGLDIEERRIARITYQARAVDVLVEKKWWLKEECTLMKKVVIFKMEAVLSCLCNVRS